MEGDPPARDNVCSYKQKFRSLSGLLLNHIFTLRCMGRVGMGEIVIVGNLLDTATVTVRNVRCLDMPACKPMLRPVVDRWFELLLVKSTCTFVFCGNKKFFSLAPITQLTHS